MTYTEWQLKAKPLANELVGPMGDIWDEDDPFDLLDAGEKAFKSGQTPEAFVVEMFGEDADLREFDELLAEESLENEDDEDLGDDEDFPALMSEEW